MQSDQSRALTGSSVYVEYFCETLAQKRFCVERCERGWVESDPSSIGFGLSNIICHRDRGCQCHPILDPILDRPHPLLFQLLSYFWSKPIFGQKPFWTWNLSSYHRCKIPYLHSCLWFYCCTHLVWEKIEKCKVLIVLLWLKKCNLFLRRQPSNQNATWSEAASQSLRERRNNAHHN